MSHVQFVLEEPPSMTTTDIVWAMMGVVSFVGVCITLAPKALTMARKYIRPKIA